MLPFGGPGAFGSIGSCFGVDLSVLRCSLSPSLSCLGFSLFERPTASVTSFHWSKPVKRSSKSTLVIRCVCGCMKMNGTESLVSDLVGCNISSSRCFLLGLRLCWTKKLWGGNLTVSVLSRSQGRSIIKSPMICFSSWTSVSNASAALHTDYRWICCTSRNVIDYFYLIEDNVLIFSNVIKRTFYSCTFYTFYIWKCAVLRTHPHTSVRTNSHVQALVQCRSFIVTRVCLTV